MSKSIKDIVKEKYGQIAASKTNSCCGDSASCIPDFKVSEDYTKKDGYEESADLELGCGMPTEHAYIKKGNTVLDLGSGAGNDVFVARSLTGSEGKVIGLDMTEEMITLANRNKDKLGYENVDFVLGDIEQMPIEDKSVDVVVSNCVLNLVPDKEKAFKEIFRVLKSGAHFSISDIIKEGELPTAINDLVDFYVGCVSGAIDRAKYFQILENVGFTNIKVLSEKKINVPDEVLLKHISRQELVKMKETTSVLSITVYAERP